MIFSAPFHPESTPVALDDVFQYVEFSALQWKMPKLDLMATASKLHFAFHYSQPLGRQACQVTPRDAHTQRAISGMRPIAVHKPPFRLILSEEVANS